MASPFHLPVTAAQVGTYFVGQYYQVLQQQPELVHQFYSEASTVIRVDGNIRETASAMLQIHTLVMSLNYTGIEIKTAHSLESWNGGVLVMVSGSVHIKDFNDRRKFVQTFFLGPQEKGYFVLNDIFHFIEEEPIHQHPVPYLAQSNLDSELNASTAIREPVSNYMLSGDIQARDFVSPATIEDNGPVDNYSFPEQRLQQVPEANYSFPEQRLQQVPEANYSFPEQRLQQVPEANYSFPEQRLQQVPEANYSFPEQRLQQVPEAENILEDNYPVKSNGSLQSSMNPVQERMSSPVEEPAGEPQKHTYASILLVAKGQYVPSVSPQPHFNKTTPPASDWNHVPEPPAQQFVSPSITVERSGAEGVEDASGVEDEVEFKSVYVRNVPPTASAFEIEEEFKKFGKIKLDGVAIRTRKDIDVCYAFVEFEDITGVQNAIKASTVEVAGQQVYIEGRRPNRSSTFRGGRGRGRGRISYQMDGPRGRFGGRSFGRANGMDGERDYNRPRGNGFYRQAPRHDRLFSDNSQQVSRNGTAHLTEQS